MISVAIVGIVSIFIGLKYWWDHSDFGRSQRVIRRDFNGPPGNPIFGNFFQVSGLSPAGRMNKLVFQWYPTFKSPMKTTLGPVSFLHLFKAEHVEVCSQLIYQLHPRSACFATPVVRRGGQNKCAPDKSEQMVNLPMTVYNRAESAMGQTINAQGDLDNPYVQAIKDYSDLVNYRAIRPWLWNNYVLFNLTRNFGKMWTAAIDRLHSFTGDIIDSRSAEWEPPKTDDPIEAQDSPKRRVAFLDLLLGEKDVGKIDIAGIKEEVDTFTFEGHDTTATGLMWAVYSLARHPDIQQLCRDEILSVIGGEGRNDEVVVEPDDLPQLKYLDRCLKESQRMWPSVPLIERYVDVPIEIENRQTIPKGTSIAISIMGLHRDPDQFPEPGRYDPDRFLPENTVNRHPFAFVPFAAGLRNCIGQKYATMEMKVVLCHLLRKFRFECGQSEEDMAPAQLFILRPTEGIWLKVTPL